MIVQIKTYVVPKAEPRPETTLEKTTRIVRGELDAAAEIRLNKTAALRTARLRKEADYASCDVPSKPEASQRPAETKIIPQSN